MELTYQEDIIYSSSSSVDYITQCPISLMIFLYPIRQPRYEVFGSLLFVVVVSVLVCSGTPGIGGRQFGLVFICHCLVFI